MSSMLIEDIMPLTTNQDDYLKYYIDESLPLFDKINTIIKKGDSIQRQALINNLNSYSQDSLFSNLIDFIIKDIGSWEPESINLFPKSLYNIIINNKLDNELFNKIFKHIINSITTGADQTKMEYTLYFDRIIEFYRPSKTPYEIYNNISLNIDKEFPYKLNDNIFEWVLSLGKFGESPNNRRLCCYLSSSLCRLFVRKEKEEKNDNKKNSLSEYIDKMYQRLSRLFEDPEKIIEMQMIRELKYIIPLFKNKLFSNKDVVEAIGFYINIDWDCVPQSMTIICLLNNITVIESQKYLRKVLFEKINEIIDDKDYEIHFINDIMDCLINNLYNNYKYIPKIMNQVSELRILENYLNKLFSYKTLDIFIKNFDKIYFIINIFDELSTSYNDENNSNINLSNINTTSIYKTIINNNANNNNFGLSFSQTTETKNQIRILFDELFINIYNKIYNDGEITKPSNSNLISLSKLDSNEINFEDKEEKKILLFKHLSDILKCIFLSHKYTKPLIDVIFDLFKKENIIDILKYYCKENNELEKFYIKKKNKLYKLMHFFVKNNYKKYINNLNINLGYISNTNNINGSYIKEFIYENNIYNKLFLSILNNIISQIEEIQKPSNNELCLLIANTLYLLIPKLYKYYKNIVIMVNNNNNINYIITNNTIQENKVDNRIFFLEKIYEEIFDKIISVIILNKSIGVYIKKEFIKIMPMMILYSANRKKYLQFIRKEILKSDSFFIRKYSINFFDEIFQQYSFEFIKNTKIYEDIIKLMRDNVNIISTGIIKLLYLNINKIISFSKDEFQDLCEEIKEIYDLNIKKFDDDIKNFDKEKNIIINKILNIKESIESDKDFQSEELKKMKDIENNLSTIENEIINFESNFHKIKNQNKKENVEVSKNTHEITRSIFQRISSTSTTFQAIKNNITGTSNNNIINQFNHFTRHTIKKNSLVDKSSNILKNLTSKNTVHNKFVLPKIGKRKDSNINSNNMNCNIQVISQNYPQSSKMVFKDKMLLKSKKLNSSIKNRTPSAKTLKTNSPINNSINAKHNFEENNKAKTDKKASSNKNIAFILRQKINSNSTNIREYNNMYIQGNNKIYINAGEK
jgi:hypothetical protein